VDVNNGTNATNARNTLEIASTFFCGGSGNQRARLAHRNAPGESPQANLIPRLPTRPPGASGIIAVGSFPFDRPECASHNLIIAVLRIGDPEPRGNTVRETMAGPASPELPPQL
jgi:hypothetical protein